jgi:hypothetical protein
MAIPTPYFCHSPVDRASVAGQLICPTRQTDLLRRGRFICLERQEWRMKDLKFIKQFNAASKIPSPRERFHFRFSEICA